MKEQNWVDLRVDADTGVETLRAHFEGHAYDAHWHDTYLIGYTEQGVQQFDCRRTRIRSTPGRALLIEPGDIHDGHGPSEGGFTYSMLYIEPDWLMREMRAWSNDLPLDGQPHFPQTLCDDVRLAQSIAHVFEAFREPVPRIVRHAAIDGMFRQLVPHVDWRAGAGSDPRMPAIAYRAREYLHDHLNDDISLEDVAAACGVDRFRLTRAFKEAFGVAPHAYLIQLRLTHAYRMLAAGEAPADVAHRLCFADQSHLGRWFRRAYGMTPGQYGKRRTNLPDLPRRTG